MILVDSERAADKTRTEEWRIERNQLPHGRMIVREDLKLSIQIKIKKHEACKRRGRMTRRHALQRIIDLLLIPCAHRAVVHDLTIPISRRDTEGWDPRLADC